MWWISTPKSTAVSNVIAAVTISLIVNFSYLLLMMLDPRSEDMIQLANGLHDKECSILLQDTGRLSLSADGYGYIVYEQPTLVDSVYISSGRVRRLQLKDGDMMVVCAKEADTPHGKPVFVELHELNGQHYDYRDLFRTPRNGDFFITQFIFYVLYAFCILTIMTFRTLSREYTEKIFTKRTLLALSIGIVLYFLAPPIAWHTYDMVVSMKTLDYIIISKCSFVLVVSILYGRIFMLITQRQKMMVEHQTLKSEYLTTRYNMLVGQINPHFFFNSLNSLSMLVRSDQKDKALEYIEQLSYAFRYVIINGENKLTTLGEELEFAKAYAHLFKIRYEDKLFFDAHIDPKYMDWRLPVLSLQPILGNAVKHNVITRKNPLTVSLSTDGPVLVVSNPKHPMPTPSEGTHIGLKNLNSRWELIAGTKIEIIDRKDEFIVRLPLKKPSKL